MYVLLNKGEAGCQDGARLTFLIVSTFILWWESKKIRAGSLTAVQWKHFTPSC